MQQVKGQTAKEISQMLLDQTGDALMTVNFARFAECFHLPHVIETGDHKRVLDNTCDLEAIFASVTEDYARKRITRLVRVTEVAEFRTDTRVEAMHITHMMSGDQRVRDPFPCYSVLEFINDRWQATATQYAVDNQTTVGRALAQTQAANTA